MKIIILSITINILISSVLLANNAIIYSATKSDESITDVTSNIEIITSSELESKHITNLTEAINLASGISFSRDGGLGQATKINIRGMHQTNTLVLLDGVKLNDPTNPNGVSFEFLDMNDIEKIEIVKGNQSGICGSDASGGVINLITKKFIKKNHTMTLKMEVGNFKTNKTTFSFHKTDNKSYIKGGFNHIKTNGFSAQQPKEISLDNLEKDAFKNTTSFIGTGIKLTDYDLLELNIRDIKSNGQFDSFNNPNDITQKYDSTISLQNLNYKHTNKDYLLKLHINKSTFKRLYPNSFTKIYEGEINTIGIQSKVDYFKSGFILIGTESSKTSDNINNSNYKTNSIFLSNSNKIGKTIFTQSLRKDKNNKFDDTLTGKVGIKYFLNQYTNIGLNYGTSYKAPTLTQLFDINYGNKNLLPEEAKGYDVFTSFKDLKISYFQNKIDNLISFHPTTYQNINITGISNIRGYEASYKKTFQNTLMKINYTKVNAQDKDKNQLGRIPKENIKLSVDYFGYRKFNFNFSVNYIGERYDRNYGDHDFNPLTPDNNGEQTGKYTIFQSVIDYKYNKSLNFYFKIDNLTNTTYQIVDGYSTSPRAFYVGFNARL